MSISNRKRFGILKRDGFTCQYCGKKGATVKLEVDHIEPKSKGGSDDDGNLITSCFGCNRGKSDTKVVEIKHDHQIYESDCLNILVYLSYGRKINSQPSAVLGIVQHEFSKLVKEHPLYICIFSACVLNFELLKGNMDPLDDDFSCRLDTLVKNIRISWDATNIIGNLLSIFDEFDGASFFTGEYPEDE